ncbi:MAG: SH3 domain-containing protein [Verrucomicrobia bacterium]|nr:SH3 domain-containing protein [Verrucomicrobiota bacterium]
MKRSLSGHGFSGKVAAIVLGLLALTILSVVPDAGAVNREYKISGNRVNVRAQPRLNSEIVSQMEYGETVLGKSFTNEWLEIVPPENVGFWIHRDFLQQNEVTVSKLNVRAGAGINYSVVGQLERGDKVEVVSEFGEWLKIAPPKDASLYISGDFIEMVKPPEPPGPVQKRFIRKAPQKSIVPTTPVMPPASPEGSPSQTVEVGKKTPEPVVAQSADLDLVPLAGQGRESTREGVLRPVGFFFGRPSRYRLARFEGNRIETICYVRGNERQLDSFTGQSIKVKGKEYWVQGVRYPVVVIEQIIVKRESVPMPQSRSRE